MTRVIHGTVHGKIIELDEDIGMSDGQQVEIQVRMIAPPERKPGDGLLRTEGALADDKEWDAIMEEIYQSRRQEQRRIPDLGEP
jgi:hypothetical protein